MDYIEEKLDLLKENLQDMTHIVTIQVQKSKQVFVHHDIELAMEVIYNSRRVNILKSQLDYDCKNILALYTPVAVDLRFILSSLKTCRSLQRIGKYAEEICQMIKKIHRKITPEFSKMFELNEMFTIAIQMLYNLQEALSNNDTQLAEKILKSDVLLNQLNLKATSTAIAHIQSNPKTTRTILGLLEIVRKIERTGDQVKDISKMIIFHHEARVVKRVSKS